MLSDRTKDAKLKAVAGMIVGLSFRDMQRLAELIDDEKHGGKTTTTKLLAAADEILGPDSNPNSPTMRGGIND